jgi:hypothetical protein
MQLPVLLLPKFGAKSSHTFTQSAYNVTAVCEIDCLPCIDEFFVNNPFYVTRQGFFGLGDFELLHSNTRFRHMLSS